jgi:hypothetical protein
VVKRNVDSGIQTHWKLKRVLWRIEETQKVISPACAKHSAKAGAAPTDRKGISHVDVRSLNEVELKTGWKCDYGVADGSIEFEFPYGIRADSHPVCDVKAEDGTEISHSLVVEMIVAEEIAPINRPNHVTPTGAARVLRMHFNTIVTERPGMGISWDEEQPPLYEDVPYGPPNYPQNSNNVPRSPTGTGTIELYTGPALPDYEELERLHERPSIENERAGPSSRNPRDLRDLLEDEADLPPINLAEERPEIDEGSGAVV